MATGQTRPLWRRQWNKRKKNARQIFQHVLCLSAVGWLLGQIRSGILFDWDIQRHQSSLYNNKWHISTNRCALLLAQQLIKAHWRGQLQHQTCGKKRPYGLCLVEVNERFVIYRKMNVITSQCQTYRRTSKVKEEKWNFNSMTRLSGTNTCTPSPKKKRWCFGNLYFGQNIL